jgi:hypothetical protein
MLHTHLMIVWLNIIYVYFLMGVMIVVFIEIIKKNLFINIINLHLQIFKIIDPAFILFSFLIQHYASKVSYSSISKSYSIFANYFSYYPAIMHVSYLLNASLIPNYFYPSLSYNFNVGNSII